MNMRFFRQQTTPKEKMSAIDFVAKDINGKPQSIKKLPDRQFLLFFLCGCAPCSQFSLEWGKIQKSESNILKEKKVTPVVIYLGDSQALQTLATQSGWDRSKMILIEDPKMQITYDKYKIELCPRIFLLKQDFSVFFTNDHPDDLPSSDSPPLMAARLITNIRKIPLIKNEKDRPQQKK
jgi:hypothetical protein